jgi:predicted lysophospholipase L1 biosynthesis ABC-type transport system permease subunit
MPGLPTPSVQAFVCQLVGWISAFAPFVLMLVLAALLAYDLAAGSGTRINPYFHGIAAVIITLVIVNLGPILGALGIAHC